MSGPGPLARRGGLRRWAVDAALWAVLTGVVGAEVMGLGTPMPMVEVAGVGVVLAVAVLLSRSRPGTALGVSVALAVLRASAELLGFLDVFALVYLLPVVALAFLAGVRSERRGPTIGVFAGACGGTLVLSATRWVAEGDLRATLSGVVDWAGIVLILLLVLVTPWLVGRFWRQYVLVRAAGWEIAERMERARAADAERARLRERARIATEMHDSLGHDLTLIGVRAAAMEVAGDATDAQRRAAADLRASAHDATLRLREIIGVLREDATESSPHVDPPAEDIATLVDRAAEAGMRARLVREGPDLDPATSVGRALHRVAQEALTNAARHAPGARVTVHVTRERDETQVRVSDTGGGIPGGAEGAGNGSGLAGLRALVEGMDGTFHAGPLPDAEGFAVSARIADSGAEGDPVAPGDGVATSETSRARRRFQGRARRRLVTAVAVPTMVAAVVTALGFLLLSYVSANSVLEPSRYAALRVGDDQAEVERALPRFEHHTHALAGEPPIPDGATCRYHTARDESGLPPVFRLCFADGRLVTKDVLRQE